MIWLQTAVLLLAVPSGGDSVLLDFQTDWCGPCRQMASTVDQLSLRGYPVRKVNTDRDPDTAKRYGVTSLPTFILVSDGQVVDRVEGKTSYDRLAQMFQKAALQSQTAQANPPAKMPERMPSSEGPSETLPVTAAGPLVAQTTTPLAPLSQQTGPDPAVAPATNWTPLSRPAEVTPDATAGLASLFHNTSAPALKTSNASADRSLPVTNAQLIASSVRIRVKDPNGDSIGSGTIVDARDDWALILTCGHLFRDSQGTGKRKIDVDLFDSGGPRRVQGELVSYDSEKLDLGLVRIRVPGPVCVAPIAPPGYRVDVGAPVATVGCNNGADPTVQRTRIRSKDKFAGPPNFQIDGLPVEGRSGGGLFTDEGYVIGVCNAADPTDNAGLYAAIGSIQAELDRAQLSYVYQHPSSGPSNRWEPAAPSMQGELVAVNPPSMPATMPTLAAPAEATTDGPIPTAARHETPQRFAPQDYAAQGYAAQGYPTQGVASQAGPTNLSPEEVAALEEIRRRQAEGAEVIIIVRSPNDPTGQSEILRLDRASPEFLRQLSPQPANIMGQAGR